MAKSIDRIGEIHTTIEKYSIEIVQPTGKGKYLIKFNDWNQTTLISNYNPIKTGKISNPFHIKKPTYYNCEVNPSWQCLQNFGAWYEKNYNSNYMQDWELDKDILVKGNKTYSPETCGLVPPEINSLFVLNNINRGKYPLGVNKLGNKYRARLSVNSYRIHLGMFDTPEEAFECYKFHKEAYIKEVADKWKPFITERIYNAMYNWTIEITD